MREAAAAWKADTLLTCVSGDDWLSKGVVSRCKIPSRVSPGSTQPLGKAPKDHHRLVVSAMIMAMGKYRKMPEPE